jgi:hypothetical protein
MDRHFFSEPEEIFPVFDEGLLLVFQKAAAPMGRYLHWDNANRPISRFPHEIQLRSQEPLNRTHAPWSTTTLEEIHVTLVHELVHAFRFWNGIGRGRTILWQHGESEYELEIDAFAYDVIWGKSHWVDTIFFELIQRSNCAIRYEVEETPFLAYHKEIVGRSLKQISGGLRFGDDRQMEIVHAARMFGVSLPMKLS